MTPVLVVDNSGRIVCRGHIKSEPGRATAHLRFAQIEVPLPAPDQAAAARTVAQIRHQVREQLEATDRRRRRQVLRAAFLHGARKVGILLGLIAAAWFLLFAVIWAIAAAFGFSL